MANWVSEPIEKAVSRAEQLARAGASAEALALLAAARGPALPDRERYEIGEALLRISNCQLGWEDYNLHPSWAVDRVPGVRPWDGKPCPLLIVMADLGFGDAIMALRHVPRLLERAEKVVVAVHDVLFDLMKDSPILAGTTVMTKSEAQTAAWPSFARWERLFSLPGVVGAGSVRPVPAYLQAPTRQPIVEKRCDEHIVGVAWRSTVRRGFPNRSIPGRLFARLATIPNIRLVTIHRDRDVRTLPRGVTSVGVSNFVETAAVISQCDLVVTADTVTAHLAPALGVPTLIGLRHWPAWIWGTRRHPTLWYQSAQLLFQDEDEAWPPVLDKARRIVSGIGEDRPIGEA